MGAWDTAVEADDTFQDAAASFEQHLKHQQSVEGATAALLANFAEDLEDVDEGPSIWMALADGQWKYGKVDANLLARLRADGFALERWQDAEASVRKIRQQKVAEFVERVSSANKNPKKLPKLVRRPAKFAAGDCLSFQLDDGRFTGAYVLATDDSDPERGRDLIVMLDYLASDAPALELFEARRWLQLHHGKWGGQLDCAWYVHEGFRSVAKRISVIGKVPVRDDDPKTFNNMRDWRGFGFQITYIEHLGTAGE